MRSAGCPAQAAAPGQARPRARSAGPAAARAWTSSSAGAALGQARTHLAWHDRWPAREPHADHDDRAAHDLAETDWLTQEDRAQDDRPGRDEELRRGHACG